MTEAHQVMTDADVQRATRRIAHEIVERNHGVEHVVLIGLQHGGVWFTEALAEALATIEPGLAVPTG